MITLRQERHARPTAPEKVTRLRVSVAASATAVPKRRGVLRRLALFAILLGVLIAAVSAGSPAGRLHVWLFDSDAFQVRGVWISGLRGMTPAEVETLAGAKAGGNLWSFSCAEARQKLRASSRFRSVSVWRIPPAWVWIRLSERRAEAFARMDTLVGVDRSGQTFPLAVAEQKLNLPVFAGGNDVEAWQRAWTVLDAATRTGSTVCGINVSDPADAVAAMDGPLTVHLGTGDFELKFRRLQRVREDFSKMPRRVQAVDLRWSDRAVVRW